MTKPSILVLDDCQDLLNLTEVVIRRLCNRQAVTARSLSEVVNLGERVMDCELAILDINLGAQEPSGVDVYHWLRRHGFTARVVFLTGHARTFPLVMEAERLGDVKIFCKPMDPAALVKVICHA